MEQRWSPFRVSEKKFKARSPPPDLSNVLDITTESHLGHWQGSPTAFDYSEVALNDNKAIALKPIPGLVILPGFLSQTKQRDLIRWSLAHHARFPNETNLDTHYFLPEDGLWNAYMTARNDSHQDFLVRPRASASSSTVDQTPPGPRQLINNTPASPESFETLSNTLKLPAAPSPTLRPVSVSSLMFKLRWANIGWYYHWGTKQYDFSKGPGTIDDNIVSICKDAVRSVDWGKVHGSQDPGWGPHGPDWHTWRESYEPDAGIVNFYQEKDTLMAHVDRSEVCSTSPLVSISLGNAAIFLIGGQTRDVDPVPLLLRSGDVVIMSGPACRRAYHGVPRILEDSLPLHLKSENIDDFSGEWAPYYQYMRTTRININVRQAWENWLQNCAVTDICPVHHKRFVNFEMENDAGVLVDLYVPRKCAATNRLITSKDHASVQISIVDVDPNGRALSTSTTFALCGQVRSQGESDDSVNRLATKAGLLRNVWSYTK